VTSIEDRLAAAGLPPLPRTAWLEIDLDALRGNLAAVRAMAGAGVPVHPVVKADAYGHGAVPVARALEAAGADGFGAPIRVLYPIPPAFAVEAAVGAIAVSAGDPTMLGELLDAVRARAGAGAALRIEIEVETGLGRGGFALDQLADAARAVATTDAVVVDGLWTHMQATEDAALTAAQLERFDRAGRILADAGLRLPGRHVAASGGLFTELAALDGVRPGLSVYGIVPDELDPATLSAAHVASVRPVMSLHARPVRVADLPAGHGISYGPTFTTSRPSRIATLPIGYGDGYARAFSNRGEALVRGVRVPVVGNVAMDGTMVDVTDVPGEPVTHADEFVLLGTQGSERITAADLARLRTTNTWEVVTQMAARLPRVYHLAAAPVGLSTLTARRG
jgi:alanine racemase